MDKAKAIHDFWSSFGLPAYDENTVPVGTELPYITYEYVDSDMASMNASLWYAGQSWGEITNKSYEINQYLSRGGRMIQTDDGGIWIRKGSPFAQRMAADSGNNVRRIVLSIDVESIEED